MLDFRPARDDDKDAIWRILQDAIARRKRDGSTQWQNGYPNPDVVAADIAAGHGYVVVDGDAVVAYAAVVANDEPAYVDIKGRWLTDGEFVVVHRVAVKDAHLGKGLAQELFARIEDLARARGIPSVKVDTSFDNPAMLRVFEKRGYVFCGDVLVGNSPRRAYEKIL